MKGLLLGKMEAEQTEARNRGNDAVSMTLCHTFH